jgi:molybdate transport system substrate-binding protein
MTRAPLTFRIRPYLVLLTLSFSSILFAAETPIIAAAASTKFALEEIIKAFHQETGRTIRVSYASSGNLARQIQQGAPFELFLSANRKYVALLSEQSKTHTTAITYALGHLVLLTSNSTKVTLDSELNGVKKLLQEGQLKHFAIANPAHAPYGIAAEEVLRSLKLWTQLKPHLVLGENAAQAAQFSSSGAAQAGLVSYSLALAPALKNSSHFLVIPANLHHPIEQSMVLLNSAGGTATQFFKYLQGDKAGKILSHYGYTKP